MQRVFLGWDGPCLPRAARWLCERYQSASVCDMSAVVVATPGARAGRRLLELLVSERPDLPLVPPTILTTGHLPERLYTPATPIASPLLRLLARVRALRLAEPRWLHEVIPHPPAKDDLIGWLRIADEANQLADELAAEALDFEGAATCCAELASFPEEQRWQALAQLHQAYQQQLAEHGYTDPHAARLAAIDEQRCRIDGEVVLIAATDLNRVTTLMLEQVCDQVSALVHAPQAVADHFDQFGCILADRWIERKLDLEASQLSIVDRPIDQARAVLSSIAAAQASQGQSIAADQITIGLGDELLEPSIQRTLDLAQLPTRRAAGRALARSRPAMLLSALARFIADRRADGFAALLRHPDIERYVRRYPVADGVASPPAVALTVLDKYTCDHLQAHVTPPWLGHSATLGRLDAAIDALLPADAAKAQPLPLWSRPIAQILQQVYDQDTLQRSNPDHADLIQGLEAIATLLREQAELDPDATLTPRLNLTAALQLTLSRLTARLTEPQGDRAEIELLGWLELQLDDAPVLIVTGVNEGFIPQSMTSDAFLPDHARRALGLNDNRRRYARDLMMLEAICNSRPFVKLISGRRSSNDDPLVPSRLTLACSDERLAAWVGRFYHDRTEQPEAGPLLLQPGDQSRFVIRTPQPPAEPITALPVTAFADYLACPHRFYLKRVLKLRPIDDTLVELDAGGFGSLVHRVLKAFGQADVRDQTDAKQIEAFLAEQLDALTAACFGRRPRTAVLLQRQMMQLRLRGFAAWQVRQRADGWRIQRDFVELDVQTDLQVDGVAFTINGRIDRIDAHPEHGFRVIDYKTGDAAKKPDQKHRTGPRDDKRWIDLQLPLYETLAQAAGVNGPIALGYVNIPKQFEGVSFVPAGWSAEQIAEALDEAHNVIRLIRDGVFWPPAQPPRFDDGLAGICMDRSSDRAAVIAAQIDAVKVRRGV